MPPNDIIGKISRPGFTPRSDNTQSGQITAFVIIPRTNRYGKNNRIAPSGNRVFLYRIRMGKPLPFITATEERQDKESRANP